MRQRNEILITQHDCINSLSRHNTGISRQAYRFRRLDDGRTQREPVGANALPLLNEHAVGLEKTANPGSLPSHYFFENGRQHRQSAGAKYRALRNLRDVWGLRDRDGKTIARIQLQHHVNIGAAISRIDNVVGTHDVLGQQLVKHRNLAIARRCANDGVDFAGSRVVKLRAENVILRDDALEGRMDYLHRRGRQNVEVKEVPVYSGFENLVKQFDVARRTT